MVKQFRKKPVIIEAIQYDGTIKNVKKIFQWALDNRVETHIYHTEDNETGIPTGLFIETLEGTMRVNNGDYVIRGLKNELYPCKPDIFNQTYEEVSKDN